ncbi:MAG TPA: DNA polymerase III subunit beta [Patescibacteria group bacterium]
MKVTLLSENLQKKLSLSNHAISSRNQLPILSHVLLDTKDERLYIHSTDLEIGIQTSIPAQIDEEGSVAVPAKLFLELISSLPQDKITLETVDGSLQIKGKKTKTIIQTSPKEEFPTLFEDKGDKILSFEKGKMKNIFGKIVFASSPEATRPALTGVLIKKTEKGIVVVATDGYRLSLEEVVSENNSFLEKAVIVPSRLIKEAVSLSEDGEINLFVSTKNNQLIFEEENTLLIGRVIDSEFPNYEKVIPTDVATKVYIDKDELLKAVKVCSIFARETANIITLSLQKEKIVVRAKTPSLGENTVEVDAKLVGEENEIAFNVRYILDALNNIPDSQITFEMTGPLNPGVFRLDGNNTFLHLIMPIRTQS